MRELITLHLGRCGNKIGVKFWEDICIEHGVSPVGYFNEETYQAQGIASYFSETPLRRFVPRAVLIDLDPATLDSCRCSPYGQTFNPDNFIFGRAGSENNWAKGALTDGGDILDCSLEIIRREAEGCESMTGFQIVHALGGGCGSGTGSVLLERVCDDFPNKILTSYSVFPAPKVSEVTVEPYNTVLGMEALKRFCNMTICLDNEALYGICKKVQKLNKPSFEDLNKLVANVMGGMSCTVRLPGTRNMSMRRMMSELVPYPKTHFFLPGYAPLNARGVQPYRTLSVDNIIQQILHNETLMTSVDPQKGICMTSSIIMRGHVNEGRVEKIFCDLQRSKPSLFAPWLDCHCCYGVCSMAPKGTKIAATWLANHTCVTGIWKRILDAYRSMYNDKAFLHWYYAEGMDENDFINAEEALTALVEKYEFLQELPAEGGCISVKGNPDSSCISLLECPANELPDWDAEASEDNKKPCGLDGLKVEGAEGPVCIDRGLICRCPRELNYCDCTEKYQWTYRIEETPPEEPKLTLEPFC